MQRFARTCRFARELVYEADDQYLWRELYLGRPFDDLRTAVPIPKDQRAGIEFACAEVPTPTGQSFPWRAELQRRTQAELIAASGTNDAVTLQAAYEAFIVAIDTAAPATPHADENVPRPAPGPSADPGVRPSQSEQELEEEEDPKDAGDADRPPRSENLRWLDRVLRKTRVLDTVPVLTVVLEAPPAPPPRPVSPPISGADEDDDEDASGGTPPPAPEVRTAVLDGSTELRFWPEEHQRAFQLRCRLRACAALAHESSFRAEGRARMAGLRRVSRAYVYDMRRYQPATLWGPFRTSRTDGRTVLANWEHLEHILNVVGLKLREIQLASLGFYKRPLFQLDALRAYSAVDEAHRPPGDWAGVTGKWRRFVCFMDYR